MIRDPLRPLVEALGHEDRAGDRLAGALHALAEAEEERDEDRQDPDIPARIATAQAVVDKAEAAKAAATAERQRLERELAASDPCAQRRAYASLLPPRPSGALPGAVLREPARRVRERDEGDVLGYDGNDDG